MGGITESWSVGHYCSSCHDVTCHDATRHHVTCRHVTFHDVMCHDVTRHEHRISASSGLGAGVFGCGILRLGEVVAPKERDRSGVVVLVTILQDYLGIFG